LGGKSLVAAALQEKKLNSLNSFGLVLVGIGSKNMFFYVLLYSSLNLKNQEISTAVRLDTVKVLNTIILVFVCGGGGAISENGSKMSLKCWNLTPQYYTYFPKKILSLF